MTPNYYIIVKKKPESNTDKFRFICREGKAVGNHRNFWFSYHFGSAAFKQLMKAVNIYGEGYYYFCSEKAYTPGGAYLGGSPSSIVFKRYVNDLTVLYYCSFEHPRTKVEIGA